MSNNERKNSKLAIAGLIVSAAIPGLFFLCVLAFESLYKQLNGDEYVDIMTDDAEAFISEHS